MKSKLLLKALKRSIKLTDKGKFSGGTTVSGYVTIGNRKYQVTVKVDADTEDWWDDKEAGLNSPA